MYGRKKKVFILVAIAVTLTLLIPACSPPQETGQAAPAASQQPASTAPAASPDAGQEQEEVSLQKFTTKDLYGNEVTQEILADYDLTMFNIWMTSCGACTEEMPALEEISREYQQKGVQIVGVVLDTQKLDGTILQAQLNQAKQIVKETKISYQQLMPSDDLNQAMLVDVFFVPETIFVDKNGNQVGEPIAGSKTKQEWEKVIDGLLREVG